MANPNRWYPKFLEACLKGDFDLDTATLKVQLVDSAYTFSATDDFLDDIAAGERVAQSSALSSVTGTNGILDAADTTLSSVSGDTITGAILFDDTGVESTSRLIGYWANNASGQPISIPTNNGDIVIEWSDGTNKIGTL